MKANDHRRPRLKDIYWQDRKVKAEVRKDEAETKKVEAETKKVEAEAKKVEAEAKKVEAETKKVHMETHRLRLRLILYCVSIILAFIISAVNTFWKAVGALTVTPF